MARVDTFLSLPDHELLGDTQYTFAFDSPTCKDAEIRFGNLFRLNGKLERGIVSTATGLPYARYGMAEVTGLDDWTESPPTLETPVLVKKPYRRYQLHTDDSELNSLGIKNGLVTHENVLYVARDSGPGWEVTRPVLPSKQQSLQASFDSWLRRVTPNQV